MGIDIYMRWANQTEAEKKGQYTGFSIKAGNVGYLREAYHGNPYATRYLVKEAFDSENNEAQIPAKVLKDRLEGTIKLAIQREKRVYGNKRAGRRSPAVKSFIDFVRLAEKVEKKTGQPVTIYASY